MNRMLIAAAAATMLFAAPAFADCKADLTKINEAMKTMTLDEAGTTKAKDWLDKATKANTAKDETACTAATAELKTLLGIKTEG